MNNARSFKIAPFAFFPLIAVAALILSGCPRDYLIPANDLKVATADLQDVYYLEMDISSKARIERGDLEDQVDIWSLYGDEIDVAFLLEMSGKMADRRRNADDKEIILLRGQAFAAIEGYASILAGLALETPKLRLIAEINAFRGTIQDTLSLVDGIPETSEIYNKTRQFKEPMEVFVGNLAAIIDIVSKVEFEPAIRETIGIANESIISLLRVLKQEAVLAESNAIDEMQKSEKIVENFITSKKFKNASDALQANLMIKIAELEILQEKIKEQKISEAFDMAMKAQYSLSEAKMIPPTANWSAGIIDFRTKITSLKRSMESINASM